MNKETKVRSNALKKLHKMQNAQDTTYFVAFIHPVDENGTVLKVTNIKTFDVARTTAQTFLDTGDYAKVVIYHKDENDMLIDRFEIVAP